jgi:hypothetical protein
MTLQVDLLAPLGNVEIALAHDLATKADSETLRRLCTLFDSELQPQKHTLGTSRIPANELQWRINLHLGVIPGRDHSSRGFTQNYGNFKVHVSFLDTKLC